MGDADRGGIEAALAGLSGAPLDAIKCAAAVLMVGDHVNTVLLGGSQIWLWRFGRIAFPLFCLAAACHLLRRPDASRGLPLLLVFAAATQPLFAWAFRNPLGNVLFTLAAGIALAAWLPTLRPLARHALLTAGLVLTWRYPTLGTAGTDFGLTGMLFPATIILAVRGGAFYLTWLLAYTFALNAPLPRPPGEPWWWGAAIDWGMICVGSLIVVVVATRLRGSPRFLPRYALHAFYPGHLGTLAGLRALV